MLSIKIFSEQKLIERIYDNDRNVLGELFMKYERMIVAHITTHGGNQDDAEDMLQEAIIVLWQKVCSGEFVLNVKLGTYLMAVAKNKWLAEMRRRQRLVVHDTDLDCPDNQINSLDELIDEERKEQFQKAFELIQPVCQKLLKLYYFEERSMSDIARILNFANADTAKAKKYQCMKALEKILGQHMSSMERSM